MKAKKRMKMIPHCYRKRGPRNPHSYSLSQLLEIGSFQRQINDLKMNNHLLTNALQESRMEAAYQSSLLKDYARDTNQILFARVKLNEMAKNLAKFATDLEEVRNCLDVGISPEYNFFQKKGSSYERKIKVPDVSSIVEESELSENENSDELHQNSPEVSESNSEENGASVSHNVEMTPILFADEVQEVKKKRSSSIGKGSLTPQLNIDLVSFKQKRSTQSRRKTSSLGKKRSSSSKGSVTHVNTLSTPQMPRIQELSERREVIKSPYPVERKRSLSKEVVVHENAVLTPPIAQESVDMNGALIKLPGRKSSKSNELVVPISAISPAQISQEQDLVGISEVLQSPSPGRKRSKSRGLVTNLNAGSPPQIPEKQDSLEISEALQSSSPGRKISKSIGLVQDHVEIKKIIVKIPLQNNSNESLSSDHDESSTIQNNNISSDKESSVSDIHLNQPSGLNEKALLPQNAEMRLSFTDTFITSHTEDSSEADTNAVEKNEDCIKDAFNTEKLTDISQTALLNDIQLPEIHEYDKEIRNVGSLTFCESDEDEVMDDEKKSFVSPLIRVSSRSKKPVKFTDFFSSDEDDIDSPFKLAVTKRYGSKKIKLNSTSTGKSCEKTSAANGDEISSDVIKEPAENDYSVYNLDVSNSKMINKKPKKKASAKSQRKIKDNKPKPLLQKCNVVKLKGGKLKFSKADQRSVDRSSEKSLQNSCVSPGGILKRSSLLLTSENKSHETPLKEIRNTDNMQDNKRQSMYQTPKRVSFAPTDLVCKFEKMSESKAIADNRKVRRTSKSAIDLKDLFEEADKSEVSPAVTDIKKSTYDLFNFSDETEVYTLTIPPSIPLSAVPSDENDVSDKLSVKGTENKKIRRASKYTSDFDKLIEETVKSKTSITATNHSSEITDTQKPDSTICFSADTEVYVLKSLSDVEISVLPNDHTVTSKQSVCKISEQTELVNNINNEQLKNSPTMLNNSKNVEKSSLNENDIAHKSGSGNNFENNMTVNCVKKSPLRPVSPKTIQKLSLKGNKIAKKNPSKTDEELLDIFLLQSPISIVKVPKRKSLFKESTDEDSKENVKSDEPATEKKNSLKKKNSSMLTPKVVIKKISNSKTQSKPCAKKTKKSNTETKSLEQSPVLADATNIMVSVVESSSRRRSKQVCYKEPSLMKKLRREK